MGGFLLLNPTEHSPYPTQLARGITHVGRGGLPNQPIGQRSRSSVSAVKS